MESKNIIDFKKNFRLIFKHLTVNIWTILVIIIALIIAIPILFVLSSVFSPSGDAWSHLASTVLPTYLTNSFWLMMGVGIGTSLLGVSTAWLVTMCKFRGSKIFEWALLLPMAAPAYLLAYTYTSLLEYYGPIQIGLRNIFGWNSINDYWFPNIRSLGGAIAMFILVLYPYVYLLTRVAFLEQSNKTLEASRTLGSGAWRSFFTIALPLARPAIISGISLALMETLSDFGTVEYFSVNTFTTGIYRTWFGRDQRVAAAQLAAVLMLFILILIVLEKWSRKQSRYYQNTSPYQPQSQYQLTGFKSICATVLCLIPITLGFLIPGGLLLEMTVQNAEQTLNNNFWQLASNSLILAVITAVLSVILAVIVAYGQRLYPSFLMGLGVRISAMGYAIPGSVIAVGVLIPVGWLDNTIDTWMRNNLNIATGLIFSGTITALIFAYLVRFLAVSFGAVDSSLSKIKPSLDDASRSLGNSPTTTLIKIHAPLMWGGVLTGAMLVFVDVMKELPATLVIRPFNFDTLAVRVYQYASDERLIEASAPALAIVLVGIIPVIFLSVKIAHTRNH
jgi:iron(III) transport system permease protein